MAEEAVVNAKRREDYRILTGRARSEEETSFISESRREEEDMFVI